MNKLLLVAALAAAVITAPTAALAQSTPATADKPAASPLASLGIDFSGHLDIGYSHLSGSGKFIGDVLHDRVFDFQHNGVAFHALDLQFSKLPENGFGGLLDLTIGKDADTIAAYGTIDREKGPANGVNKRIDVTQAFLHYGRGPFSVIGGKYVTLAGAEVIKSANDVNYSRSILFGYAIPFTHTGVRASYKVNDMVTLLGGVNNGWDTLKDTNTDKTIELGTALTLSDSISIAAQGYSGKEQICNYPRACLIGPKGTRNLIDLVATYKATDKLTFVINYDYGSQQNATLISGATGKAKWDGWAGYAQYQFTDQWRLVLRGEYFNDKDGYRTVVEPGKTSGQKWKEATLTLAYLPTKNIEIRAEVRADRSDQSVFLKTDGVTSSKSQNSVGLEFLYKL